MIVDTSKFELIRQADQVLSNCGRPIPPCGSVVYIPRGFLIQAVLPLASNQSFFKEITGDTTWSWRAISTALSATPPSISALVILPDGKVLFNGLLDLTVIAGFGSNRYLISPQLDCPPGSKIQLDLDDNPMQASAVQPVSMLCEGAYAYYLRDGRLSPCPERLATDMPRIFAGPSQNLLAPCWMSGAGPAPPEGYEDSAFTYGNGSSNIATVTIGGVLSAKTSIQIDDANDFVVHRFLFDLTKSALVTAGHFMARIRAGSGYSFTDDYVSATKYLGSAMLGKGWWVRAGDEIEFDLVLVDGAGTGTVTMECFAEGVKRRRIA